MDKKERRMDIEIDYFTPSAGDLLMTPAELAFIEQVATPSSSRCEGMSFGRP